MIAVVFSEDKTLLGQKGDVPEEPLYNRNWKSESDA